MKYLYTETRFLAHDNLIAITIEYKNRNETLKRRVLYRKQNIIKGYAGDQWLTGFIEQDKTIPDKVKVFK